MSRKKRKKGNAGPRASRPRAGEAPPGDFPAKRLDARGDDKHPRAKTAAVLTEDRSMWPSLLAGSLIFLIVTPAVVGPYGQKNGYTPDLHMAAYVQVGAMIILSLFWVSAFFRKRMQIIVPRSPVVLPLVVFYGWAMLSVLWADSKYEAVNDALDWTGAFLCGLLLLLLLRDVKQLRTLLFFLLVSGSLMAVLGIGQYLFAVDWIQQHVVPAATFSNKNMAGQYGVLILPIAVMFFLRSGNRRDVWFFAVIISLIAAYIFYTRSRGVLLGFLVEMIVLAGLWAYFRFKHGNPLPAKTPVRRIALAVSLALFAGLAYLTPAMFGNAEKVAENSLGAVSEALSSAHGGEVLEHIVEHEQSGYRRFTMWGNSAPIFKDHFLIGAGLGNWTVRYAEHQSWFWPDLLLMSGQYHANAHNDYIEMLCELGIVGFAVFVWLVVSLFRITRRLLLNPDKEYFFTALPLITAIMGIAANAMFSFPLKQPIPILITVVCVAALSNLYTAAEGRSRDYVFSLPPPPVRGVVTAVFIFFTVGLFVLQYNWYQSELHYRQAALDFGKGQYKSAYDEASLSLQFNPLRNDMDFILLQHLVGGGNSEDRERGFEILEKAAQVNPYSPNVLANLATAYNFSGLAQEESEVLARLAEKQPVNFSLKPDYAFSLSSAGKSEGALKVLELYRRHLWYAHERSGRFIRREEERMNLPDYTEDERFPLWKKQHNDKVTEIAQADKDIEKIKRGIRKGKTPGRGKS